jgi:AGCS family alanine or glycine:cation symporter
MKEAIRYGVARGLFSNESGLGSAPIVTAAAQTKNPVRQALGSVLSLPTVWSLADITNGLMAIPNLVSLVALKGVIVIETRRYLWSNILEEEAPPAAELFST